LLSDFTEEAHGLAGAKRMNGPLRRIQSSRLIFEIEAQLCSRVFREPVRHPWEGHQSSRPYWRSGGGSGLRNPEERMDQTPPKPSLRI